MPALTHSLWVGFPTSWWHCLAVAHGCLPPPCSPWLWVVFFFGKHVPRTPKTFLLLFTCCMSPISMLRYAQKRCILISRPCRTTRSLFAFTEGHKLPVTWQPLFICCAQVYVYIYIAHSPSKQMPTAASSRAAPRSTQPPTAWLEQFVQMKHHRFSLLKQVLN